MESKKPNTISPDQPERDKTVGAGISQRECERKLAELFPNISLTSEKPRPIANGKTELKIILDESTMKQLEALKGLLAHRLPQATYSELITTVIGDALKQAVRKTVGKAASEPTLKSSTHSVSAQKHPACDKEEKIDEKDPVTIYAAVGSAHSSAACHTEVKVSPRDIGIPSSMLRTSIPTRIKQAVWRRAGSQCEFIATTARLQVRARWDKSRPVRKLIKVF